MLTLLFMVAFTLTDRITEYHFLFEVETCVGRERATVANWKGIPCFKSIDSKFMTFIIEFKEKNGFYLLSELLYHTKGTLTLTCLQFSTDILSFHHQFDNNFFLFYLFLCIFHKML